ncbi:hypothetical protein L7F22_042744 [Adiantum nelumboides]|nr:hypothetical protein [Adiantum nelumboides]
MAEFRDYIAQVFRELQRQKYQLSKEEVEVTARCQSKMKSTCLQAFIVAGGALWSAAGFVGRVHLMPRLVGTFAVASLGAIYSLNWSVKHCFEEVLTLDGSRLQERLITILQYQAVLKPGTRAILEKHYYLEPLYDDSGQATPGVAFRKRQVAGENFEKLRREVGSFGKDPDLLKNADKTPPNLRDEVESSLTNKPEDNPDNHLQRHRSNHTVIHDDAFEDLFTPLLEGEAEDLSKIRRTAQKHTSKMGVLERREYNRARYLEWQAKRKSSEWDSHTKEGKL